MQFKGSRLINVRHNQDGFRDIDHGVKNKGRIAFVGDSFVWGYDVEQEERFTEKLQAILPDWEILNMGVSGYGTAQEFLLIQEWFDHYKPDILFLVYCSNDPTDNLTNSKESGYYKPYFEIVNDKLVLGGIPVSKSLKHYLAEYPVFFKSRLIELIFTRYLDRVAPEAVNLDDPTVRIIVEMKNYIESRGAKFYLAFTGKPYPGYNCSFCESKDIQFLALENEYIYNSQGNHWTPEGHDFVCSKIHSFLVQNNIVNVDLQAEVN